MIRLKSIQGFKTPYPTQQTYVKAVPFLFSNHLITNITTRMQKCVCWCHILRVFCVFQVTMTSSVVVLTSSLVLGAVVILSLSRVTEALPYTG